MKTIIAKTYRSLKNNGLKSTLKKGKNYLKFVYNKEKHLQTIEKIVDVNSFESIIVFENNFCWNKIMRQRPQQIAANLPSNTLMFYHSHDDNDYENNVRIKKITSNLVLIDLGYYRDLLLGHLSFHNNKYLMIYSTDYIPYNRIKLYEDYDYQLIYEYVDDFNVDLNGEEMYNILTQRHKQILKDDPVIICTANKLYEKCLEDNCKYVKLVSNGVDYDHFTQKNLPMPSDIVNLRNQYKTLICYYGALASWFDYDLIKKIAKNKNYGIILIGQDYDQTLEKSKVLDCKNVHYLGKKSYQDLPSYGNYMDLFIIPFVINDITKATSPVKIFEYMAMQKPIITTALPECKKYQSVFYSNNHNEFIDNLEKALKSENDKKYLTLLDKEAKENNWKSKAKDLIDYAKEINYLKFELQLRDILKKEKYDRIVVWRSPFGWNVPLFQRPQHIAKQLAKKGCLVFYEVTPRTDFVKRTSKIYNNLYLINFENYLVKYTFNNMMKTLNIPKYLQIYSTNWCMDISELKEYQKDGYKILYEYIDDISPELAGTEEIPEYIIDKYNYAMKNKDVLIVTTAKALYEDVKKKRGEENLVFSCNGVDYNFFQQYNDFDYELNFISVIKNGKINLCYYGALAKWFDYELIRKIDKTNKYNIILFGVKYDNSYDESGINNLPNVYYFGSRDYSILKYYAKKMDILTIPFVINSITKATSPLKLFEYMALNKPIVTTNMDECRNYKSVLIGKNHSDFLKKLEEAYKLKNDNNYKQLLIKEGKENDWEHKAEVIIDLLKKHEGDQKMKKIRVMSIFGTRPEAIKMAPLVKELEKREEITSIVCVTAQHREMLDQVLKTFNIKPDYDLNIMKQGQTLGEITTRALTGLEEVIRDCKPDIVLVHGDTTTTFAGGLAAFYNCVSIGHVEAGLRTNDKYSPYPEEMNRQMVDCMTDMYFAPTSLSKENLLNENIPEEKIYVTGNTAIDAMATTVEKEYTHPELDWIKPNERMILLTAHRRENLGEPMRHIFKGIKRIVDEFKDVKVIYPIHLNPKVREVANEIFSGTDRVKLIEPLEVFDFHNFQNKSFIILTDSGGIQEEAPSLGKPVLVLRDTTERPEGIAAGTLKLVGTDENTIYEETKKLLTDKEEYEKMSKASNPYGDGHASEKIVDAIIKEFTKDEKNN